MAPPEVSDRDVPQGEVFDEISMMELMRMDLENKSKSDSLDMLLDKQPSIEDKANGQLAPQTKDNFGFKKAANGFLPGRPSPPRPINVHHLPKDIRLYHKHLLSDHMHEADADVIRFNELPFIYIINKDRVDVQSNIPPSSEISVLSSSDLSPQNDQPQSKAGVAAILYGSRIQKSVREAWKVPDVTSFSIEKHMKELFEIGLKTTKLVFGGYKGNLLPPSAKATGWITAISKELQAKYDKSLLNSDQRSNRNCEKVEKRASFSSSAASSLFLDEGGSVLRKHHSETQSVKHQRDVQKRCPSDEQHKKKQSKPTHHLASSADVSGSTQSPSSSSRSKGNNNKSTSPSSQQSKRGRASNQGGETLNGGSQAEEENSDGLPRSDPSKESRAVNTSSQAKEKEEEYVAFEQKLHLSEELPSSASTKIPPDKAAKEQASQASSYEPPRTEMQSQIPPALLCNEAASQPKVKQHHSTATTLESEGIAKDLPIAIHDDAASQLWSLFNVKPPPYSQASHDAEICLPEVEWNESATKSSASVEVEVQLREYGPISKDSEFVEEKSPPYNELLQIKVATEESNKIITNREPVQIEKSPSSSPETQTGDLHSPALPTTEALPTVNQHALNDHSLFGPPEDGSTAEFFPLPFSSSAGDDGFLPQQPSSQVCKQEVVTSNGGEIYQHSIEEAGQPGNAQMVVSEPTLPADWMQVNQSPPQAAASESLCLLPYTTRDGRIVSHFSDLWGFTAFVDVDESEQIL